MLILLASAAHALSAEAQISALMLQHDPILHFARRLLPPERAAHASALYAWCRRLDEIVDDVEEPGDERGWRQRCARSTTGSAASRA